MINEREVNNMAYLNEFPHVEGSTLNLDWILEQYSTFDQRLQEIVDEFHQAVTNMEGQITELESDYERKLANFEGRVLNEIDTISNAIEQISNNVADYVQEHMDEWQLEAMTDDENIIIGEYDPTQPVTEGGQINEIIINNVAYKTTPISGMRTFVFHTTLTQLNAYTASNTTQIITITSNPELYNFLNNYLEKIEQSDIRVPMIATPYFSADYNIDSITFNEYHSGYFTPMDMAQISKVGDEISVSMPWARKTGVTFTAPNGFYTNVTIFLAN